MKTLPTLLSAALLAAASSLMLIAGCGSSDPASDCAAWAAASCERDFSCYPELDAISDYTDVDTCSIRVALLCPTLLGLPHTNIAGGSLGQCATDISNASCDSWRIDFESAACDAALRGTRDGGKDCNDDTQCSSGFCDRGSATFAVFSCGTCGSRQILGESCVAPNDFCDTHLYCDGACKQAKDVGESCEGATCLYGLICKSKHCAEPGAIGDSCKADADCNAIAHDECVNGACQAPNPPFLGAPCHDRDQGEGLNCASGSYCYAAAGGSGTGLCNPTLADGASCTVSGQDPCQPPMSCTDDTCQLPDVLKCGP